MAMFMVLDPAQYERHCQQQSLGDILTDLGAAIAGGLGLAASGNIHPGRRLAVRAGTRQRAAAGRKNVLIRSAPFLLRR